VIVVKKYQIVKALNKWPKQTFKYGVTDCCQFASFMVKELTGVDHAAEFDYRGAEGAEQIITQHNGLVGLFTYLLGPQVEKSEDGSPCIVYIDGAGEAGGIKYGDKVVCVTAEGLTYVPEENIIASFDLCHQ
jgi:hypothetical protein